MRQVRSLTRRLGTAVASAAAITAAVSATAACAATMPAATGAASSAAKAPATATAATASSPSASGSAKRVIKPGPGIYWGANIGPQLTGGEAPWDTAAIPKFESSVHKKLSIDAMGWPFATCTGSHCVPFDFPAAGLDNVRAAGAIPLVSFDTAPVSGTANDPINLHDIISGKWDYFLKLYAQEVKAWGHPFFLRFDWEMNGNWFPWSPGVDGNTPQTYVQAWRHVHNIFTKAGATNATWVWCPNVEYYKNVKALYPGSKYVDWTCLDGYNNGKIPGQPLDTFQSWDSLYSQSYSMITGQIAPNKPMMVAEFASSSFGGNKAAWIANALAEVPKNYPKIRALVYYDRTAQIGSAQVNWSINSSAAALSAFAKGIANPAYVTNRFGGLGAKVIPVPTR